MFAASVLGSTDVGAESLQETLLRLAVNDLAPGLRSQIPVFKEDGKLLTVSDLGWGERGAAPDVRRGPSPAEGAARP